VVSPAIALVLLARTAQFLTLSLPIAPLAPLVPIVSLAPIAPVSAVTIYVDASRSNVDPSRNLDIL
jgi:hypothetical protein